MRSPVTRPAHALLLALSENKVLGTGPNGEAPTAPIGFELTPEELEAVRTMNATAAIVMHYGANDWSQAQIAGLTAEFAAMRIEVTAVTDAGFDPEKQVDAIERLLAGDRPDIIVSIPTDPIATASAYRKAASLGDATGVVLGTDAASVARGAGAFGAAKVYACDAPERGLAVAAAAVPLALLLLIRRRRHTPGSRS